MPRMINNHNENFKSMHLFIEMKKSRMIFKKSELIKIQIKKNQISIHVSVDA